MNDLANFILNYSIRIYVGLAIILLIAILPLPYGYYDFLRVVVCLTSSALFFCHYINVSISGWPTFLLLPAILFNPFFPINAWKGYWFAVDLYFAAAFLYQANKIWWKK